MSIRSILTAYSFTQSADIHRLPPRGGRLIMLVVAALVSVLLLLVFRSGFEVLEERLGAGLLIAIDPLPITCGDRTHVIEGYAGESAVDDEIERILAGQKLDLVLSDMAPNISGVRAVDQARAMDLADISLDSCHRWMNQRGAMAIKAFQGEGLDDWVKDLKKIFKQVHMTKPKASRPESREVFVVAIDFLPE